MKEMKKENIKKGASTYCPSPLPPTPPPPRPVMKKENIKKGASTYCPSPLPPTPPPPRPVLNLEDCVEGKRLIWYKDLSFSSILEDPNFDKFGYKTYHDFDNNLKNYWNNTNVSWDSFKNISSFTPYGKDMIREVSLVLINIFDIFPDRNFDFFLFYNIKYIFSSKKLNKSHTLLFRFDIWVNVKKEGYGGDQIDLYIGTGNEAPPKDLSIRFHFDNALLIPTKTEDPNGIFLATSAYIYGTEIAPPSQHTIRVVAENLINSVNPVDNIFDFGESNDWKISEISALRSFFEFPQIENYFKEALPNFEHVTAANVKEFKEAYGYLMSGFKINPRVL